MTDCPPDAYQVRLIECLPFNGHTLMEFFGLYCESAATVYPLRDSHHNPLISRNPVLYQIAQFNIGHGYRRM